jgi:predicted dehydrogenase
MRLGIIGLGIMGERLLRVALDHPGVEVVAAWDPSADATERLAGLAPVAASAAEVIAASEAVYVASPPASHVAHGTAVLAARRTLFLEKPLASDVAEARAFVAAARGQRAAVNFPMASSPAAMHLRDWLRGVDAVARIDIELGFREWPRLWQRGAASWLAGRAEGGFLREVGSHFLWLAQRIGGTLAVVEGRARFPAEAASEDLVEARFTAGAVPVTLRGEVGRVAAEDTNCCTITWDGGQVRLRDWSLAERWVDGAWVGAPDAVPNARMRPVTLGGQLDKLAALVRGEATDLATLEEALGVQEAVERVLAG